MNVDKPSYQPLNRVEKEPEPEYIKQEQVFEKEPSEIEQSTHIQEEDESYSQVSKAQDSSAKTTKPVASKRPKAQKRNLNSEGITVYKNCDINSVLNSLRQESVAKNKKSEVDERRFILLKSQISNLVSKNNALLDINK